MKSLKKYLNSVSQFADAILNIIGCLCQNLIIFSKIFSLSQHALNTDKNTRIKRNTHTAFSLVEMLMALLVASLLMAALAPVMTKKFNENVVVSGTGNSIIPSGGCVFTAADGLQEEACTIPSNIHTINAIIASGGGGGGGAVQTAFSTTKSSSEVSCNNPGSANSNEIIL